MSSTPGTYKKCEVKSAALLMHGNTLVATLSPVRRDQIDLVTCREAADAHQVPATSARCCRRHSIARQLSGGIHSGIFPVYMPLVVPYPRKCAFSECLKLRVQSSSPQDPVPNFVPAIKSGTVRGRTRPWWRTPQIGTSRDSRTPLR